MFSTSNKNVPLGRWTITYDNKQLDKKVYYANHDHCGDIICKDPINIKNLLENKNKNNNNK